MDRNDRWQVRVAAAADSGWEAARYVAGYTRGWRVANKRACEGLQNRYWVVLRPGNPEVFERWADCKPRVTSARTGQQRGDAVFESWPSQREALAYLNTANQVLDAVRYVN